MSERLRKLPTMSNTPKEAADFIDEQDAQIASLKTNCQTLDETLRKTIEVLVDSRERLNRFGISVDSITLAITEAREVLNGVSKLR